MVSFMQHWTEPILNPGMQQKQAYNQIVKYRLKIPVGDLAPIKKSLLVGCIGLLFILLLIFLLAWLYNRFLAGRFPAFRGKTQIRLVSTFHVAPRQKVVVLEINGQQFACGVTPTAISLISAIPSGQAPPTAETGGLGADASKTDRSRRDFLKALDTARRQSQEISNRKLNLRDFRLPI